MTGNLTIALLIGVLYTVGTYLLLQRTLTRVVLGLSLLGHGANLLLLQAGGPAGLVPFVTGDSDAVVGTTADPLPQALALTAIVITFGVSAIAAITSSVKSRGWGEVKRTRSRPSIVPQARSSLEKASRSPMSEP